MKFEIGKCPKCGRTRELMYSNNPLSGTTVCFGCIEENLDYTKLSHADFFCRSYNIPFDAELWLELSKEYGKHVFQEYAKVILEDKQYQPNLAYATTTADLWAKMDKEWQKCRSLTEILNKIEPIKESYIERGRLKWGEQYTFSELIKLDSIYTKTLKANNIINPMQKEAVKTLCKLQIEMDEAIRAKDAKAIRDFSNSWSTFAKQANLEDMINETKTDDILTVADLYKYMEDKGFRFSMNKCLNKDEIDIAINDIKDADRRLILEATGLQQTLEDMINKRKEKMEEDKATEVAESMSLQELMNFTPEDGEIATEDDSDAENLDFSADEIDYNNPFDAKIVRKETAAKTAGEE